MSVVCLSSNVGNGREADHVIRLIENRQLSLGWQLLPAQHERVRSVGLPKNDSVLPHAAFFNSRSIRIRTRIGKNWLLARKKAPANRGP
jgi:hypothetical protein